MNEKIADILNSLTDEQKEKVRACKSLDEFTACLAEMGVELSDELLDEVAGGFLHFGGGDVKETSLWNALLVPSTHEPLKIR